MVRGHPASFSAALAAAITTCLIAASCAPVAQAQASSAACKHAPKLTCTTLQVPLDREQKAPGMISLEVGRMITGEAQSKSAVVALAGGPGQSALPLAEDLGHAIQPALAGRDLIVFDQRGTGESDPLTCAALKRGSPQGSLAEIFGRCAGQIGPGRAGFTSEESVKDIEAIRQLYGYQKLVLYGTSYGTKVSIMYAEQYPQYVEALVLDSVVPSNGPEAFALQTFAAVPRVLRELCSEEACKGITQNPVTATARLARQLAKHPLQGAVYSGAGKRESSTLGASSLYDLIVAGDLNPALRSLLPAAVVSALDNDPEPLLQLYDLSVGLTPHVPHPLPPEIEEEEDNALFWATTCEERAFPWERSATSSAREAQAKAALRALPSSDFYPFNAHVALEESLLEECAAWPNEAAAPPAESPLPDVPALLLSGAQDLRTPTANAKSVAAKIPDAQLLVVPYTGHSVIGSDFSSCASEAVAAFFANSQIAPCKATADPFKPTPITPTKLAALKPTAGLHGQRGRTMAAVLETILDLERQVTGATIQAETALPNGSSFGGLRGGYARLGTASVYFKQFSFIPGVELSGTLTINNEAVEAKSIRIAGHAAAHGTIRIAGGNSATGMLGGHAFHVSINPPERAMAATAGAGPSTAQLIWPSYPLSPRVRLTSG